jgi:hypothetical protein
MLIKHNVLVNRLVSRQLPWYHRYGFRWYLLLPALLLSRFPIFNIFLVPIALIAVLTFLFFEKIDRESAQIRCQIKQLGNETLKWRRGYVGEEKVFHELLHIFTKSCRKYNGFSHVECLF